MCLPGSAQCREHAVVTQNISASIHTFEGHALSSVVAVNSSADTS